MTGLSAFSSLQWSHGFITEKFNLVLCLFSFHPPFTVFPTSHSHLLHISVSLPGCWHNTDGRGTGKDVNRSERCLFLVFHCREETPFCVFLFAFSLSTISAWNLLFKIWKYPVSAYCFSLYRMYLSVEGCVLTHRCRVYICLSAVIAVVFGSKVVVS